MNYKEAIKAIEDGLHTSLAIDGACQKRAKEALEYLKSQSLPEPKTGQWLIEKHPRRDIYFDRCSYCGFLNFGGSTRYCPECGARMKVK